MKNLEITTGWINLNTACNNRCEWCYMKEGIESKSQIMSFKMVRQSLQLFREIGIRTCILIGGEPTLYPFLPEAIQCAVKQGMKEVTIVTNGRRLKNMRYTKELCQRGLNIFSISIHSGKEEIHDEITNRKGSWRDAVRGIKNALKTKREVSINIVVGQKNTDSITESLPIILDWGVDEIIIGASIPHITSKGINGDNSINPCAFAELLEHVVDISPKIKVLHELPLCIIERDTFIKLAKSDRIGFGCHIGIGRGLIIDASGYAIPCNSFHSHPLLKLFENEKILYNGNSFMQAWTETPEILEFRRAANVFRTNHCAECGLWDLCNSGCPIGWGYYEPEEYITGNLKDIKVETVNGWWKTNQQAKGGERSWLEKRLT